MTGPAEIAGADMVNIPFLPTSSYQFTGLVEKEK
jgi:hypothetical protein